MKLSAAVDHVISKIIQAKEKVHKTLTGILIGLVSAVFWLIVMVVAGVFMIIAGIYVLFGPGWALMAGGFACLFTAVLIRQGINNG